MSSTSVPRPSPVRRRRGPALAAALLFLLAAGVRLFVLAEVEAYPRFELIRNRLDDQVVFDAWARAAAAGGSYDYLASGHEFAHWAAASPGVFPVEPLYPHLLALFYRAAGFRYDLVRAIQMIAGALTVVFVYLLARRFATEWAAVACGAAAALYGPLVFYELAFLRSAPQVLAVAAALWLLLEAGAASPGAPAGRGGARRIVLGAAAGLMLAGGVLLGAALLPFAIAAVAWLGLASRGRGTAHAAAPAPRGREPRSGNERRTARAAALAAASCLLAPIVAVSAINTVRSGRPAFVSANGPYNLLLGNLHDAPGNVPTTTPAYERLKASGPPESIDLLGAAAGEVARHPGDWLRLLGRKLRFLLDPREWPNNLSYDMGRRTVPALRVALVELWAVLPLALVGMVAGWPRRTELALLYLFVAGYSLSLLAVFVLARLRLPLVPALLVFAAVGLSWWGRAVCERRLALAAGALALVLAASGSLAALPPALRPTDYEMAAAAYFSLGAERERAGDASAARRRYARALALDPAHTGALERVRALGPAAPERAVPRERLAQARALCERARRLAGEQRWNEALDALEAAERLAPHLPLVHHYFANVLHQTGRRDAAMRHLELAVELAPANDLFRHNLAALRRGAMAPPS